MKQENDIWTIRHKTRPGGCTSAVPYCGYDKNTLLQMIEQGYELFRNGNKVTLSEIKREAPAKSDRKFTKNSQPSR